ncbi:MAG: transporter substrate-binding domain-containing protein, partial [Thermoanaerobaculia bacterium]
QIWAPSVQASDLVDVEQRGRLVMLCWPHQESTFVRRTVELGPEGLHRFAGIDVDILDAYARHLGVELEVRPMEKSFAELIPSLLAGKGDVIGSSLTITEKRAEKVAFSVPYFDVRQVVVARRGSGLSSAADLDRRTAAAVPGSSQEESLLALGLENLTILPTEFTLDNYIEVVERNADLAVVDSSSATKVLAKYPQFARELEVAFEFPTPDFYGFAVRPDSDLLQSLDAFLEQLRSTGELGRIKARYLPASRR